MISARATINSLEVLSLLTSSYLYALCQALDLRALQRELQEGLSDIVRQELSSCFDSHISEAQLDELFPLVSQPVMHSLDNTSTMDAAQRMTTVAAASTTAIVDFCIAKECPGALIAIPTFRQHVSERAAKLLNDLRSAYLSGEKGAAPASAFLGRTRPVYEYVRVTLGIRMHGSENFNRFAAGPGVEDVTVGQNISLIHEVSRYLLDCSSRPDRLFF